MSNLKKKWLKLFAILPLISVTMMGCWDKIEIDNRIFVSIIGIDAGTEIDKIKELKKIQPNEPFSDNNMKKIKVTYGFPDISQVEPGKGGNAEEKTIPIDAYSLEDAYTKASSKSSRDISFGHLKLLILNSNIFEYPEVAKEISDYLERQPAVVRNMQVIVCDGNVENYINYKPAMEKNIENYIVGLVENAGSNSSIIPVTFNDFIKGLNENNNTIVPYITIDKENKELNISQACIIKNFNFKNTLSNTEVTDIKMLRGKFKGGKKVIFKQGHPVDFEISDLQRKILMNYHGQEKLSFTININIEGEVKQYYFKESLLGRDILANIEKDFNESLSEELERIIKVTQSKYQVDLIGIGDYIKKYHPDIWKKVKGNWNEIYKNIPVTVNVNTNIRRIGAIK